MRLIAIALVTIGVACDGTRSSEPYTLYRNSPLDQSLRVQWASFDAAESDPGYNRNNCDMAARLLNANLAAFRKANGEEAPSDVGFWCEAGGYSKEGLVPNRFDAEFPTDVPAASSVPATL